MKKIERKIKIKWLNVLLLLILLFAIGIILHDAYMVGIYSIISGQTISWTWYGFLTFIGAIFVSESIIDYLDL